MRFLHYLCCLLLVALSRSELYVPVKVTSDALTQLYVTVSPLHLSKTFTQSNENSQCESLSFRMSLGSSFSEEESPTLSPALCLADCATAFDLAMSTCSSLYYDCLDNCTFDCSSSQICLNQCKSSQQSCRFAAQNMLGICLSECPSSDEECSCSDVCLLDLEKCLDFVDIQHEKCSIECSGDASCLMHCRSLKETDTRVCEKAFDVCFIGCCTPDVGRCKDECALEEEHCLNTCTGDYLECVRVALPQPPFQGRTGIASPQLQSNPPFSTTSPSSRLSMSSAFAAEASEIPSFQSPLFSQQITHRRKEVSPSGAVSVPRDLRFSTAHIPRSSRFSTRSTNVLSSSFSATRTDCTALLRTCNEICRSNAQQCSQQCDSLLVSLCPFECEQTLTNCLDSADASFSVCMAECMNEKNDWSRWKRTQSKGAPSDTNPMVRCEVLCSQRKREEQMLCDAHFQDCVDSCPTDQSTSYSSMTSFSSISFFQSCSTQCELEFDACLDQTNCEMKKEIVCFQNRRKCREECRATQTRIAASAMTQDGNQDCCTDCAHSRQLCLVHGQTERKECEQKCKQEDEIETNRKQGQRLTVCLERCSNVEREKASRCHEEWSTCCDECPGRCVTVSKLNLTPRQTATDPSTVIRAPLQSFRQQM
ncbi:hypothetical protein BLNAU_7299 [Blattamonas nauphoetae]|uniref:Uncharacterized protein n=1 Tax=Blattamonas nauphoetae TaxID=2049346 RepID=A0ABQ9Y1M3_9EUKA|nr:hypothetical protein BLNAU_7299 [Blattamonas nauphoetae]